MLRTVKATRYVIPLREGGSLPAIVEADDCGLYVVKFRGAGQGILALIAELIAGEIGRALGLRVPEIVFIEIDPALGRNEPDYEIRQLLKNSAGLNLALDYLPGSVTFDPAAKDTASPDEASLARIVFQLELTHRCIDEPRRQGKDSDSPSAPEGCSPLTQSDHTVFRQGICRPRFERRIKCEFQLGEEV